MGYSHYVEKTKISKQDWKIILEKFKLICEYAEKSRGIDLDYNFDEETLYVEGSDSQRLGRRVDMTGACKGKLLRPSKEVPFNLDGLADIKKSEVDWALGQGLDTNYPICPYNAGTGKGMGKYETFVFVRVGGFECCKTNYYPYDIVVQAIMLLINEICPDSVILGSDGGNKNFVLGYLLLRDATGIKAKQIDFDKDFIL